MSFNAVKKKFLVVLLFLLGCVAIGGGVYLNKKPNSAQEGKRIEKPKKSEEQDPLKPYKKKLEEINERLGTSFRILSAEESTNPDITDEEIIEFYTAMSMDEFEQYVLELYEKSKEEMNVDNASDSITICPDR
ncbi:MAG: hypothetical protein E7280_03990 [Lachnospiraceae bacterium]|nr:hypothetical protein [Lachnospiraceae bacterium]